MLPFGKSFTRCDFCSMDRRIVLYHPSPELNKKRQPNVIDNQLRFFDGIDHISLR
jgi:hypothetical protein